MGFGLYWQPAIVFFMLANKVHSFIQFCIEEALYILLLISQMSSGMCR